MRPGKGAATQFAASVFLALLIGFPSRGQTQGPAPIRVESNIVVLPVSVLDKTKISVRRRRRRCSNGGKRILARNRQTVWWKRPKSALTIDRFGNP